MLAHERPGLGVAVEGQPDEVADVPDVAAAGLHLRNERPPAGDGLDAAGVAAPARPALRRGRLAVPELTGRPERTAQEPAVGVHA